MAPQAMPDDAAQQPVQPRQVALDGLRGLAAVVVFAHHALALLYAPLAGINPAHRSMQPGWAAVALHTLPLGWMFNGAFAVSFFFVLSGFVLTLAAGPAPGPERMARLMSTRLLRLLPLVVAGTLGGFALFRWGMQGLDMLQPYVGVDRTTYVAQPLLEHHAWSDALRQMAFRIWGGADPTTLFDPPLWSIGVELQGSLYVFMLATVFARTRQPEARYWVGAPVGLCLMGSSALCFLTGMFLAERLQKDGVLVRWPPWALRLALFMVALWASVHPWDPHLWLPLPVAPHAIVRTVLDTGAAALLLTCGLQMVGLRRLLTSAPVQLVGEASYGLYVIHAPLLYVAAAPLMHFFLSLLPNYNSAAWLTASLLLALSILTGWALVRYVDTPMARWSKRRVAHWLA